MEPRKRPEPELRHSQDARRQIYVPVVLALCLMLFILVVLFAMVASGEIENQQVQVIAGIMMTLFILLPMALVMLVMAAVLLMIAFGSGDLYKFVVPPLRNLRDYSEKGATLTRHYAWRISDPLIAARARGAGLQTLLSQVIGITEGKRKDE